MTENQIRYLLERFMLEKFSERESSERESEGARLLENESGRARVLREL